MLATEPAHHLVSEAADEETDNHRNGSSLYLALRNIVERLTDATTDMERGGQSICHHVRRTIHSSIKLRP